MKLLRYLGTLGYGTRREVERLFSADRVTDAQGRLLAPAASTQQTPHEGIRVDDAPLDPPPGSVWMLHKPSGYVCSTSDRSALVYDLLPPRLLRRSPVVAPVGRLDRDTTGLLLLTDDGPLLHRLTSPRSHLPKAYHVSLAEPITDDAVSRLEDGTLLLDGERTPVAPARCERLDERRARLTITEGRYHQVRRMFAAVGNHVQTLHRASIGSLTLGDLAIGAWRVLEDAERDALSMEAQQARAATAAPLPAP